MTHRVITWDWRESMNLDDLADAIKELSGGTLAACPVDTHSDQMAVVITDNPDMTPDQAFDAFTSRWESEDV